MTILHTVGNIFESETGVIAIPVNVLGVAGKGLALDAAQRYPEWLEDYRRWCNGAWKNPGNLHIKRCNDGKTLISFPTKIHWRMDSELELIDKGLTELERLSAQFPNGVALPMLGCGLGGLDWPTVRLLIYKHFEKHPLKIDLYGP